MNIRPFPAPTKIHAQVWQMKDPELIRAATVAAIAFERTGELSNLQGAVLEEFASRFDRLKGEEAPHV